MSDAVRRMRHLERLRREYERFHNYAHYLATEWTLANVPEGKRRDLDVTIVRNSILGIFGMCRQDDLMRILETDARFGRRTSTVLDLLSGDLPQLTGRLINECDWQGE